MFCFFEILNKETDFPDLGRLVFGRDLVEKLKSFSQTRIDTGAQYIGFSALNEQAFIDAFWFRFESDLKAGDDFTQKVYEKNLFLNMVPFDFYAETDPDPHIEDITYEFRRHSDDAAFHIVFHVEGACWPAEFSSYPIMIADLEAALAGRTDDSLFFPVADPSKLVKDAMYYHRRAA